MATNPYATVQPVAQVVSIKPGERTLETIDARFTRALKLRGQWEGVIQECYDYALPMKESMFEASPGRSSVDHIYDETAVVGVQEFASRLLAGLVPNYSKWSEYTAGPDIPEDQRREVNAKLEDVTEYVFEVIHNSNFAQEATEAFLDVAVGTASMWVGDGDEKSPILCKAIPVNQLVIDKGPDDMIDLNGRARRVQISMIPQIWRGAKLSEDMRKAMVEKPERETEIRECVYRDYDKPNETYLFKAFSPEFKEILLQQTYLGEGSNPFITFRWSKLAGEVWGRGPLLNALPAIKTCNLTVQLILENAEMSIAGAYTAEDDGVINTDTVRIVPGSVIPIAPGSNGLRPLTSGGSFDVAQLVLQDMRANIKRALYNEMLGNPERTPMSATEVSERMADLSRQIGSAFGRLNAEFVNPFLRRVLFLLRRQGRIELPSIGNRVVKVQPQSPLSRAQAYQEVSDLNRFMELVAARFGPQLLNVFIKGEEAVPLIAGKMNIPDRVIRSKPEQAQIVAEMAKVMGGMNGPEGQGGPPPAGA